MLTDMYHLVSSGSSAAVAIVQFYDLVFHKCAAFFAGVIRLLPAGKNIVAWLLSALLGANVAMAFILCPQNRLDSP